jgi:hypothetical protein
MKLHYKRFGGEGSCKAGNCATRSSTGTVKQEIALQEVQQEL